MTLKAGLGPIPLPLHVPVHPGHGHHSRHRGPSYQRRQERRKAAREAAATDRLSTEDVDDPLLPDDAAPLAAAGGSGVATAGEASNANTSAIVELEERVAEESTPKVSKNVTVKATNPSEDNSETDTSNTESSDEEIKNACDRCDFVGKTAGGLKTHKSKKHLFGSVNKTGI